MQVRPPLTCTLALYKNNITLRDLNATITIRRREKIETVFQFYHAKCPILLKIQIILTNLF